MAEAGGPSAAGKCCLFRVTASGSVFGLFVVIIEGDTVLFRQRGVLVVFSARTLIVARESQIDCAGTSLLELSRFFEAAMTTLLHGRAPNLEK